MSDRAGGGARTCSTDTASTSFLDFCSESPGRKTRDWRTPLSYWARFRNPVWWGLLAFCLLDAVTVFVPMVGLWVMLGLFIPAAGQSFRTVLQRAVED